MAQLEIAPANGSLHFSPGERLDVTASWQLDKPAESIELRLIWYTFGTGDEDVCVVETFPIDHPRPTDSVTWSLRLPGEPYSFQGTLIGLCWSLELLVEDGHESSRCDIVIAPGGQPVDIRR